MTIRLMDRQGTPAAQVVAFQDACMNKRGTFVYGTQKEVDKHINDTAVQTAAWAAASQKDVRSSSQAVKRAVATADLFSTYRSLDYFSDARPAAKEVLADVLLDAIDKAKCPPNRTAEDRGL